MQVSEGETGFQMATTQYEFIKINSSFIAHFHVFNKSNGMFLKNDSVSCYLNLFDSRGEHTLNSGTAYFEEPFSFLVNVSGDNFSDLGLHAYIIQCNDSNSNLGGFLDSVYTVTIDGYGTPTHNNFSFFSVILIFIFFIILVFISFIMSQTIWVKSALVFLGSIIITTLLRFTSWFVTITNADQIGLIHSLDKFYGVGIMAVKWTGYAAVFIIFIILLKYFTGKKDQNWKDDWDNWGK